MDLLDRLELEKKQQHSEFKVEKNLNVSNLGEIIDGYKESLKLDETNTFNYERFLIKTYTPEDIEAFSKMVYAFQDQKNFDYITGQFLSGLINKCCGDSVNLDLTNCETPINYIGYCTTKSINVKEDIGKYLGVHMRKGKIVVNGNASDWIGNTMHNGEIEVFGNAGFSIGMFMRKGLINIHGDYKSLGVCFEGGDIYHKNNCIVKNGIVLNPFREKLRSMWYTLKG